LSHCRTSERESERTNHCNLRELLHYQSPWSCESIAASHCCSKCMEFQRIQNIPSENWSLRVPRFRRRDRSGSLATYRG
jgi:hypothetical protein